MIDVNAEVRTLLEGLEGVKVTFYHPGEYNKLPVISYYELTTTTGFRADNAEQGQVSNVSIDIWGRSGYECSQLAIRVDAAMQAADWYREFSRDMPPENGVYHKAMRFSKHIYF